MGSGILLFREGLVTMRPQTVWTTDHIIMGQRYHIPTYVEIEYFFRIVDFLFSKYWLIWHNENVGSQSTKYFLSIPR